jgi:dTDP-4-amino-4,6-dideoxygalactose transaminase
MSYKVPFVDAKKHYSNIKPEIDNAILTCLANGDLVYRSQLKDFEKHLAEFVGVKYAIGLNSGYHALHFSLLAAGVGAGDEVITVAHTFVATVSAIVHCGATPVLIDVAEDYNMNVDLLEKAITPRTKAILPVHLNGRMADMARIMEIANKHKLAVIEDAAQSLGAKVQEKMSGAWGLTGCFSFYPFKILGCCGDGGAITTNDATVAQMISRLRYNGEDRETGEYHYHGYTALLDNIQAAILDAKLKHFPAWVEHRRKIAELYHKGLSGIEGLHIPNFDQSHQYDVFQNYVIRTKKRNELRAFLKENGVETLVHWPKPMWEHKALGLTNPGLPETESISKEVISLPMSAEATPEHVDAVVKVIKSFFGK